MNKPSSELPASGYPGQPLFVEQDDPALYPSFDEALPAKTGHLLGDAHARGGGHVRERAVRQGYLNGDRTLPRLPESVGQLRQRSGQPVPDVPVSQPHDCPLASLYPLRVGEE
jgi:hypothetical protein